MLDSAKTCVGPTSAQAAALGASYRMCSRLFLIDRAGDVREIYSSLFLHPQTVLNDIETLLMEKGSAVVTVPP